MAVYQATRRWAGRWREEWLDIPNGALMIAEGQEWGDVDTTGQRTFVFEADLIAFINRDSPGTLTEYKPNLETRQFSEPPQDRQAKTPPKARQRRQKKKMDDN